MQERKPARTPRKFTIHGKTLVTAMSFAALVGGWDLIGRIEAAAPDLPMSNAALTVTPAHLFETVTPLPTIVPLRVPAVATLAPMSGLFDLTQAAPPVTGLRIDAPPAPVLAPLPALAPIPAMPSLPPPPLADSSGSGGGGGNGSGGGNRTGGS